MMCSVHLTIQGLLHLMRFLLRQVRHQWIVLSRRPLSQLQERRQEVNRLYPWTAWKCLEYHRLVPLKMLLLIFKNPRL